MSGRRSGGQLATTLVAIINILIYFFSIFHFFFSVKTFSHFGFCRLCGVAGSEQVPPAPLGWYLNHGHYFQIMVIMTVINIVILWKYVLLIFVSHIKSMKNIYYMRIRFPKHM